MKTTIATKEDAANACWRIMNDSEHPKMIHAVVLSQIELPKNPDLTSTQDVVEEIIEIAWKRGFMDAMLAMESNALVKVPVENN